MAEESIDFFQAWHVVHFLASGSDWDDTLPAGFMIGGDYWAQAHPEEEPFRLLDAGNVKLANQHLHDLSDELVNERLAQLASDESEIYGSPIPAEAHDLVISAFEEIRAFFSKAAANGQAVSKAMC